MTDLVLASVRQRGSDTVADIHLRDGAVAAIGPAGVPLLPRNVATVDCGGRHPDLSSLPVAATLLGGRFTYDGGLAGF
jgi:hypothetical protein